MADQDYPSPDPIANKLGEYLGLYKEKPYAIFEFLEGEHDDNNEMAIQVSEAIGRLHSLTKDYIPKHNSSRETEDVSYAWRCAKESVKQMPETKAKERLNWVKVSLGKLQLPDSLPEGICHGDTNHGNFLYTDGKLSAVLDFDQANYAILLLDIASMLMWYAWKEGLDYSVAKRVIGAYEDVRPLSVEERRHVFDALKLVNIIGTSWFLGDDTEYNSGRKVIGWLDDVGRNTFFAELFGEM